MARRPADDEPDAGDGVPPADRAGGAGDGVRPADRGGDAPDGVRRADRGHDAAGGVLPADRASYESEQAALLRALIRGDVFPDGFAPGKAAAASRSLWRKRMRAVQAAWPALAIGLGDRFEPRFETYARAAPPPAVGHGLTDGLAFARTLARDELTDDARVELLLARAVVVTERGGGTFRDRRGVFAGAVSLRAPRRIVVVTHAPLAGRRVLVVPLGRHR